MDITSATSTNPNGQSGTASTKLADDFDTFLTLLTSQLQNQDPLEPLETNEFTQQLIQFTQVEQSIATNENLELLISLNQAAASGGTVSYLGQTVVADGATSALEAGAASWNYDLARDAETTTLTVTNANGQVVYSGEGDKQKGAHSFTWNGKDQDGNTLPDGLYTLSIEAKDSGGNAITASTTISGRVTAIDFSSSDPLLTVGGVKIGLDKVKSVSEPTS